jgi:hypothetical protein
MRQVETSDPELVRLTELIEAGQHAILLRLAMPVCGCSVGAVHTVDDQWLLLLSGTQHVQERVDSPPSRFYRRRPYRLDLPLPTWAEVGCDHRRLLIDSAALHQQITAAKTGRRKFGRSVEVPARTDVF